MYPRRWVVSIQRLILSDYLIMKRAGFFVDGFNLYHAIDNTFGDSRYKWLNLRKLADNLVSNDEVVKNVFYFSAYCTWNEGKRTRHKQYVKALSSKGVQLIKGNFQRSTARFFRDKMEVVESDLDKADLPEKLIFKTFEEKKTDVNIAVKLIEEATNADYDVFYIISADSDFSPALKYLKKYHRKIKLINVLPINSKGITLGQVCDYQIVIDEDILKSSLLEDSVKIGTEIVAMPTEWK